jgi:integrase
VPKRGRRRGRRGDGSIIERDGKYLARWSQTEGGIRKRYAKTFTLRNDAEWWLSQARRHQETPDDPLLVDYLERWLVGKRSIRTSTRRQYEEHVRLHIVPVLGGYRLSELHRRHVEAFVEDRLRYISPSKRKRLSPSTVGKLLVTLRSALDEAVPRDIPTNPAAKVEAPKVERERVDAMTPTLAAALIAAVRGTWMEHIVRVLLGSGMRLGEAIALDQGDVHEGWVSLRKSKTTIRAVPLSDDAADAIAEAVRQAPRVGPREPVFYSPRTGDRLRASSLSHALPKALAAAGLPPLTPHKLRHGTATLMARGGVSMRDIAEQLGHANPSLTARTYAHVAPDTMRKAVKVLDEAVR